MMTRRITPDQARALARLAVVMRVEGQEWDEQGVYAAIGKAAQRGDAIDVVNATLAAALDPKNRTPAVIPMDGAHWRSARTATTDHRFERCAVIGHGSFPAWNCSACRSETLEVDKVQPNPDPEVAVVAPRGADKARRALAEARKEEA